VWRRQFCYASTRRPACHRIFDKADNGRHNGAGDAAAHRLAEHLADIDTTGSPLKHWQQRSEKRPTPAPPSAPAMVLPSVPKSRFFIPAPAALPPTAPATSWMMRLISVADTKLPPPLHSDFGHCNRDLTRFAFIFYDPRRADARAGEVSVENKWISSGKLVG
jgi:hypothetical protein